VGSDRGDPQNTLNVRHSLVRVAKESSNSDRSGV
jgi:hypothetical protein